MDDVFGNCTSVTVMEADLSRVLANLQQDIVDLQHLQQQAKKPQEAGKGGRPVPQPRITTSSLRHTQSEVVGRDLQGTRPRALSTGGTSYPHSSPSRQHHGYINLQLLPQHHKQLPNRPTSTYDNVPQNLIISEPTSKPVSHHPSSTVSPGQLISNPARQSVPAQSSEPKFPAVSTASVPQQMSSTPHLTRQRYMNVPLTVSGLSPVLSTTSSNTPESSFIGASVAPQHGVVPHRFHHSYIELWSGMKEERESFSDSECEELKKSFQEPPVTSTRPSPGYVEMSSPYIRSPQVTSPFNGSAMANFASRLASYAGHQPRNIFCPFCPRYFSYEKSLGSHIHKSHRDNLNNMIENGCRDLQLQLCPICQAQFLNTSILPKHLIDFHRASVVEILEKNSCIVSDAVGIHCPFCSKKVPHGKTGEQVLLYHMQQLHVGQFDTLIKDTFRPTSKASLTSLESLTGSGEAVKFQPGVTSTPGLSNRLASLAVHSRTPRSVEALNLDTTWSSHTAAFNTPPLNPAPPATQLHQSHQEMKSDKEPSSSPSKGILRNPCALTRKASVKRELRFSVPPVTSEEVFIPESPEQTNSEEPMQDQSPDQQLQPQQQPQLQKGQLHENNQCRGIPVRVDSLSAADFMDLNEKCSEPRKRRRLGLGFRSRKAFKKKDKENFGDLAGGVSRIASGARKCITENLPSAREPVVSTPATRTFRRPKPVAIPRIPQLPATKTQTGSDRISDDPQGENEEQLAQCRAGEGKGEESKCDTSPLTHLKLYSPLRMFRCNSCRVKFCDNESLSCHIAAKHRGLLCLIRPQYGCGVCSAKFFENKYLVKHCLQHHTSLLEIRSPCKQKINIYKFKHT